MSDTAKMPAKDIDETFITPERREKLVHIVKTKAERVKAKLTRDHENAMVELYLKKKEAPEKEAVALATNISELKREANENADAHRKVVDEACIKEEKATEEADKEYKVALDLITKKRDKAFDEANTEKHKVINEANKTLNEINNPLLDKMDEAGTALKKLGYTTDNSGKRTEPNALVARPLFRTDSQGRKGAGGELAKEARKVLDKEFDKLNSITEDAELFTHGGSTSLEEQLKKSVKDMNELLGETEAKA